MTYSTKSSFQVYLLVPKENTRTKIRTIQSNSTTIDPYQYLFHTMLGYFQKQEVLKKVARVCITIYLNCFEYLGNGSANETTNRRCSVLKVGRPSGPVTSNNRFPESQIKKQNS